MSAGKSATKDDRPFYETGAALSEYLLFHYGALGDILPYSFGPEDALEFPARCVSECLGAKKNRDGGRALDLGCAVGRSSFELARHFRDVVGIDFSSRFIEAARTLAKHGAVRFHRRTEGERFVECEAAVPAEIDRDRVRFETGDAMALDPALGAFDLILCANLIDRLPDPAAFLKQIHERLNRSGLLIVTSPYTWTEAYTPRNAWLGSAAESSFEALQRLLEPTFALESRRDLPFLIREHDRKYQWSVADATTWRRRPSES